MLSTDTDLGGFGADLNITESDGFVIRFLISNNSLIIKESETRVNRELI